MDVKIGCTGWSYHGWVGPFYPRSMPSSSYLRQYSGIFDITEINSTFYKIPSQYTTKKWFSDTPKDFVFSAKMPKQITHDARLRPNQYLDQFLNSIKPLGNKMKIIVIQLPPSLPFDESEHNLEKMANHLPDNYRYAVEGRHPSWFSDPACRFLSKHSLCLVWNDVQGVLEHAATTTDFVYVRMIGDRSIPESQFGRVHKDRSDSIKNWVQKLEKIKDRVSFAAILANNHYEGFSPATANKLRLALGLEEIVWNEKGQATLF